MISTVPWLRWWDEQGNLLLWAPERIEQERPRVEQERQRAEAAEQRALQLAEQLPASRTTALAGYCILTRCNAAQPLSATAVRGSAAKRFRFAATPQH